MCYLYIKFENVYVDANSFVNVLKQTFVFFLHQSLCVLDHCDITSQRFSRLKGLNNSSTSESG